MNHRFLWICAKSGIAGSYGNSIFSFSWSFPNVLHSDCSLHSIIYCLQIWGWWPSWLVYLSFAFFWYLVMLSIFSYAFWSFVCLLWRNVCLYTLPTFLWDCLFDTEVHELLYILEIIVLLFALFANISSDSVSCLFVFGFFLLCGSFWL